MHRTVATSLVLIACFCPACGSGEIDTDDSSASPQREVEPNITRSGQADSPCIGDLNHDSVLDIRDAALLASALAGPALTGDELVTADTNGSGAVDAQDVIRLLDHITGKRPLACNPSTSVTLEWDAPTTNTDGTCLTDLAGFKVSRGQASDDYGYVEAVALSSLDCTDSGSASTCGDVLHCTYAIADLPSGTWFFAVQAYNAANVPSSYSNEASKTVP